jgi:hypothetical protein
VSPVHQRNVRLLIAGAVTAIVLAAGSTVALAAVSGAFRGPAPAVARCTGPTLAGSLVDVTVTDMRGGMSGPDGPGPMMNGGRRGLARVLVSPSVVPAGTVSLRVFNQGVRSHELVVLPLSAGQVPVRVRLVQMVGWMRRGASARRHAAAAQALVMALLRARPAG